MHVKCEKHCTVKHMSRTGCFSSFQLRNLRLSSGRLLKVFLIWNRFSRSGIYPFRMAFVGHTLRPFLFFAFFLAFFEEWLKTLGNFSVKFRTMFSYSAWLRPGLVWLLQVLWMDSNTGRKKTQGNQQIRCNIKAVVGKLQNYTTKSICDMRAINRLGRLIPVPPLWMSLDTALFILLISVHNWCHSHYQEQEKFCSNFSEFQLKLNLHYTEF